MWVSFAWLMALVAILALGLNLVALLFPRKDDDLVEQINQHLPQTQCAQCGYPGCRPYAEAIARGQAEINLCPPGGAHTIEALGTLLARPAMPLDSRLNPTAPQVAVIDEQRCIGCTLCIPPCPVDAIIGAHHALHRVLPQDCTGCELCVAPCPVDCIEMQPAPEQAIPIPQPVPASQTGLPCIRCDQCSDVCPVQLPAQALYHTIRQSSVTTSLARRADECIECGLCEEKCPSHIPLLAWYQLGKARLQYEHQLAERAQKNLALYEQKQRREHQSKQTQNSFWDEKRLALKQALKKPSHAQHHNPPS